MSQQSPINEKQDPPCDSSHEKESQPANQESSPFNYHDNPSADPHDQGHFPPPPPIDHVGHELHPNDPFYYEEKQPEKKKGTIAKIALIGAAAIFGGWGLFKWRKESQYQEMRDNEAVSRIREHKLEMAYQSGMAHQRYLDRQSHMDRQHSGHHQVDGFHHSEFSEHGVTVFPPEFEKAVKTRCKHQGNSKGNKHFRKPQNEVERNIGEVSDESDDDSDDDSDYDSNSDSEDGHERRPKRPNRPNGRPHNKSERAQPEVRVAEPIQIDRILKELQADLSKISESLEGLK